jgi:hypothetical protein
MVTALRSTATRLMQPFGYVPVPAADPEAVRAVLSGLAPMATEHALIRLGPDGDGGYLVPDDLDGVVACLSPGVSTESGFDLACAQRGMDVFLADASVDGPAATHERFHFTRRHVGAWSDATTMTLDEWVARAAIPATGDLLLQMDIEGAEYETLLAVSDALLQRLRVLVVECHELDGLFAQAGCAVMSRAFARLAGTHICVHIHPNNCGRSATWAGITVPSVAELTFLRRDRVTSMAPARQFPHPLDADNHAGPTYVLPASLRADGSRQPGLRARNA